MIATRVRSPRCLLPSTEIAVVLFAIGSSAGNIHGDRKCTPTVPTGAYLPCVSALGGALRHVTPHELCLRGNEVVAASNRRLEENGRREFQSML